MNRRWITGGQPLRTRVIQSAQPIDTGTGTGNNHGAVELIRMDDPDSQSHIGQKRGRLISLPLAGLQDEAATRTEPLRCPAGKTTVEIKTVRPAIKCQAFFMQAGFRGHGAYRACGDIGRVDSQDLDPTTDGGRQRSEQIALVDLPAHQGQVASSAIHGAPVHVRCVQLDTGNAGGDCSTDGAGTTAQIHYDHGRISSGAGPRPVVLQQRNSFVYQKFGASAGNKNARVHLNSQSAKACPTQHMFQREAGDPQLYRGSEFVSTGRRREEQLSFVLCEDTPRGPKPGTNVSKGP